MPAAELQTATSIDHAYHEALSDYLSSGSPAALERVRNLVRDAASSREPIPDVLAKFWRGAMPCLLSATGAGRPLVESALAAERTIGQEFERAAELDRLAHMRVAAAYSQKIREVQTLLDSLPAFAFLKDSEFRYASVNQIFCDALRLPIREVVSKSDDDLFPAEVAAQLRAHDREVSERLRPSTCEVALTVGGKQRSLLFNKAPVVDSSGHTTGLIGIAVDLTEQRRVQREQQSLATALGAIGEMVLITDTKGRVTYVNPAFEGLASYSAENIVGRSVSRFWTRQCRTNFREMSTTLKGGKTFSGPLSFPAGDGALIDTHVTVSPVRESNGKITSFVAIARDTREQRRMLEALRHAASVKSDFVSVVSHELRTPLTAIKEGISIVEDGTCGELNPDQQNFLSLAKRNVDRLHRLINDTLDFSKLDRDQFQLDIRQGDLNSVVEEVVRQQRPAANQQNCRLELSLDDSVPGVAFDADRVSQILINLTGNAIRYSENGWVEVATEAVGGEVVVRVQDSGPGIPTDKLERIFEAFVQLSTGPGRQVGGTGLGLAICKRLVDLHRGRIWVESEVGKGSAFYFALAIHPSEGSSP